MIRLFIADPMLVPQDASNGIKVMYFDPKKYTMPFEPKVKLTIDNKNKQHAEQSEARENYKALIADPTNNLEEVKKLYIPKFTGLDKDEVNRIITQPTQPMGADTGAPVDPSMGALMSPMPQQPQGGMA
jgi:hypothetical protein